jgi:hypothetical protein
MSGGVLLVTHHPPPPRNARRGVLLITHHLTTPSDTQNTSGGVFLITPSVSFTTPLSLETCAEGFYHQFHHPRNEHTHMLVRYLNSLSTIIIKLNDSKNVVEPSRCSCALTHHRSLSSVFVICLFSNTCFALLLLIDD